MSDRLTPPRLGVGIIGCGQATQALHLPALASLPDLFRVRHLVDASQPVAAALGERLAARSGTSVDALLQDPEVDVVLVASPDATHARFAIAACRARKCAVLVEKPLAMTTPEAQAVVRASAEYGVPVQVGAMHRYDPAFIAALPWMQGRPDLVIFETFYGPNDAFREDVVQLARSTGVADDGEGTFALLAGALHHAGLDAPVAIGQATLLLLSLSAHDLPLLRTILGVPTAIESLGATGGMGFHAVLDYAGTPVILVGYEARTRHNEWRLRWIRPDRQVEVRFPQSWATTAASEALLHESHDGMLRTTRVGEKHESGFRGEWRHLHEVALGKAVSLTPASGSAADVEFIERAVRSRVGRPASSATALGFALLGGGAISALHAPLLATLPETRLMTIASRSRASAEKQALRFGCDVATFDQLDEVLARPDVGAVLIAGPPAVHAAHARRAVGAGRHAIVEKPLCRTLAEADELVDLAERSQPRVAYAENYLFSPGIVAAAEQLRAGRIGALRKLHVYTLHGRPGHGDFLRPEYGGGALFDLGVHAIHWAWRMAEFAPVAVVMARIEGEADEGDAYADVTLRFAAPAEAVEARVEVSWRDSLARVGMVATGDRGELELAMEPQVELALRRGGEREPIAIDDPARGLIESYPNKYGYVSQLRSFVASFRSGRDPAPGVREGRAVLEIVIAAYASAGRGGVAVTLPFDGDRTLSPYQHWRGR